MSLLWPRFQWHIWPTKNDCRAGRFSKVPGDDEFIPLPD
jgi:hypothetical protein